jgi:hypothetical protein
VSRRSLTAASGHRKGRTIVQSRVGLGVLSTVHQIGNAGGAAMIGALYFTVQSYYSDRLAFLASLIALTAAVVATAGLLVLSRTPRPSMAYAAVASQER